MGETSDSEDQPDGVAPLPIHSSVHRSFSRHIRSSVSPHSQTSQLSSLLQKQLSICDSDLEYLDTDSQSCHSDDPNNEVNDSHSLLFLHSAAGSRDSQYVSSESESEYEEHSNDSQLSPCCPSN